MLKMNVGSLVNDSTASTDSLKIDVCASPSSTSSRSSADNTIASAAACCAAACC